MKSQLAGVLIVATSAIALTAQAAYQYPFQNPRLPQEQRITDLLSRMTIEEKIFCFGIDPSVPRLGVKGSGHIEGLSGLALGGHGGWAGGNKPVPTTQFPEAKGLGQTWDPALLRQVAAAEGYEARFAAQNSHYAGMRSPRIVGGLVVRGPNADLSRDPRWGRNGESYGEDPYLTGTMTIAFVKGLQGDDPHYWLAASLMKHFLANENEDGRMGSSSNFDDRLFYEYYSRPFRKGIEQGGSRSMMAAYNAWNGTPMTINPILKEIVEEKWGLDGIICTDRGSLTNLVTKFKAYASLDRAAAATVQAGINQYLDHWEDPLTLAYENHLVTEKELDDNLRGVFRVMIRLGQLDPPSMVPYAAIGRRRGESAPWDSAEHRELDRRVTDESIVLLKNEKHALPLDLAKIKSIAVIGPYADRVLFGFYSGLPPYAVSPLEGIRRRAGAGVPVQFSNGEKPAKAAELAGKSDIAIVVLGNHSTCDAPPDRMAGRCLPGEGMEGRDRKSINLDREDLVRQVYAANPRTILVLTTSFPYAINWPQEHLPAILEMAHSSDEEGSALADVLFGDYNPGGRLTQTWPKSEEQIPPIMDYNIRHGATYLYFQGKPLYPFGYGLSYTQFSYSHLSIVPSAKNDGSRAAVSVDVTNTGDRPGDEVVQMYLSYPKPKVDMPRTQLAGFQRISLQPGETRTVTMPLKTESLEYWSDRDKSPALLTGQIEVGVGSSSADILLHGRFNLGN